MPFYGSAAATEKVPQIRAALQIHYAEDDKRVNAMRPEFEAALQSGSDVRSTTVLNRNT